MSRQAARAVRDGFIPALVSVPEAAGIIGVAAQAVHQMLADGRLRGAKVGGTWVLREAVVREAARKRKALTPE